jgi:hypothetical protein
MSASWTLANAEHRASEWADTFEIPPREARERLVVGDLAKLVFLDHTQRGERMWVEITAAGGVDPRYQGRLRNEPVQIRDLRYGAVIRFGPEHITEYVNEDDADDAAESKA